jgi:chromosomal replication initiator protein
MPNITVAEIWKQVCNTLQQSVTSSNYETWILSNPLTDFRRVGEERAIGVITSPTAFHSTNVERNFYAQIKEAIDQVTGLKSELQFKVGTPSISSQVIELGAPVETSDPLQPATQPLETQPEMPVAAGEPSAVSFGAQPVIQPAPSASASPTPLATNISSVQDRLRYLAQQQAQQPITQPTQANPVPPTNVSGTQAVQLQQQSFTPTQPPKTSFSNRVDSTPMGGLFSNTTMQSVAVDRARLQAQRAGLRLDYTFDTFAVSTTNEMAHAAAMAVSNQPGTAYNPLFIYGGVGVGKTHLMHAVGNNILRNNPEAKILYCTGEDFTNEIVSAIQTKKTMFFKEKYRNADVWLIDDVQFIAGKNTVQEEFFHTFNTITKHAGQIILTSDRPPHEISLLEDRLRSRFEAGLMVDIQQPSFELRTAILLIKSTAQNLHIPMDLAQSIAAKVESARKIEGIIKSIKSEVELKHRAVDFQLIEEILSQEDDKKKTVLRVKPNDVIKVVADHYHIKQITIKGLQRVKQVVRARHVAMYLLKHELNISYVDIGKWFSNRDHTSAMHAVNKIESDLHNDADLNQEVSAIRTTLRSISR